MRFFVSCFQISKECFHYKSRLVYGVNIYVIEHYVFKLLKKIVGTNNEK